MADRFYCVEITGPQVKLTEAEAHHAIHVMRLKRGDQLELFDGVGMVASGTITAISRRDVTVDITSRESLARKSDQRIVVAACLPKGDRQKWMLEKLTEIGVDEFIPLQTERSTTDAMKLKTEKRQACIVSAAKQCRRNWLMTIDRPKSMADLLSGRVGTSRLLLAHPYPATSNPTAEKRSPTELDTVLLIGPEGGFTAQEVDLAVQAGCAPMTWPETILRTETAAVAMSALLIAERSVMSSETVRSFCT